MCPQPTDRRGNVFQLRGPGRFPAESVVDARDRESLRSDELYVDGVEQLLTAGDYVHAPAGTIHSFAFDAHNTRMLGMLTSDVFEPFFDATGIETDDSVYTEGLIDPSWLRERLDSLTGLDVQMVGAPPTRLRATGL